MGAHQLCRTKLCEHQNWRWNGWWAGSGRRGQVQVIADRFSMVGGFYDGKVVPLNARTCAGDASEQVMGVLPVRVGPSSAISTIG